MSKLWKLNPDYDPSKPQSWDNMPYKRLYRNLTSKKLMELLRDAKCMRWEILDLSRCDLKTLPDTLGELEELRLLDLGNLSSAIHGKFNIFTNLPDSIGNLSKLQSLRLYCTRISVLPESIGLLSNLQSLNMRLSVIRTLPDSIGKLTNLQILDLDDTEINALTDSIKGLSNLRALYLSKTHIRTLPDSIRNLKKLNTLNLSYCHLKSIPYSVVALRLPFVIDRPFNYNCVNLTGVTLDEGDLQLFTQPREVIEAHYQEKARSRLGYVDLSMDLSPPQPAPNADWIRAQTDNEDGIRLFSQTQRPRRVIDNQIMLTQTSSPTPQTQPVSSLERLATRHYRQFQAVQTPPATPTPEAQSAPTWIMQSGGKDKHILNDGKLCRLSATQRRRGYEVENFTAFEYIVPQATQTPSPQPTPKKQPLPLPSNANSPFSKAEKELQLSEQLDRLNIENAKLNALYLRLKIGLLVAAVGLIILLLGTQTSNLSAEKFMEWLFSILGGF